MSQFKLRFPKLCAWCGTHPPQSNRLVKLSSSVGNRRIRMQFKAPICSTCDEYATALKKAASKRETWTIIGCIALALPVVLFLMRHEPLLIALLIGPIAGIVLFAIVTILMQAVKLDKKLNERAVGPAPEGYASRTHRPCQIVGVSKLKFYNDAFQQQFAIENPDLTK